MKTDITPPLESIPCFGQGALSKSILCLVLLSFLIVPQTVFAAGPGQEAADNTAAAFIAAQKALGKKPNRLIDEKSPYLLKHAFNPVDWFPWGDEAFSMAEKENKPVFLSIGYSTCHWCNVMEEESFDNPEIAEIMNRDFIAVKVDREERPDIDSVYMAITQQFTGSGGWPMTLFLTPQRKAFYAGTYFPPDERYGKPGLKQLLGTIHKAWQEDRNTLVNQADKVLAVIGKQPSGPQRDASGLTKAILGRAMEQLSDRYDERFGGFGTGQKFPRPIGLNLLLRIYAGQQNKEALQMVRTTLSQMADGGIRDHLGGGFHRYAVDRQWRVPHFEKMLYDQAQLVVCYLEAFQITGDNRFAEVAEEIISYVLNRMTSPAGGFYSAEDADSPLPENRKQKGEGAYYLWSCEQISEILGQRTASIFNYRYGVAENGNAPYDPQGEFTGKNILYVSHSIKETAGQFSASEAEILKILADAGRKLLTVRNSRPRPYLDDQIVTAWNALMISALARAATILHRPAYLTAAHKAADFLLANLYRKDRKKLFRRFRDGEAGHDGQLADYAFLSQALLDLYTADHQVDRLQQAEDFSRLSYTLFHDPAGGGLFETSASDSVPVRVKLDFEGAEPSGNAIAALNFLKLFQLTGNKQWQQWSEDIFKTFGNRLTTAPASLPQLAVALDFSLSRPRQIVIAGNPANQDTRSMLQEVYKRFTPYSVLLVADGGENQEYLARSQEAIRGKNMINGKATAYVCEDFVCKIPTTDVSKFVQLLEQR